MQTKFIKAEDVAEGTMRFYFEKPADFEYRAGQSIDLSLIKPPETDEDGNMRAFSLVSAPQEEHLAIATRMRDTAFKRVLKGMAPGTEVNIEGPFGDMMLPEDTARPIVFLAGGIGITLFYSILKDAAARALPHRITLLYSNRNPEEAAFLAEIAGLSAPLKGLTFVPTMTGVEESVHAWNGEKGRITSALIKKHTPADEDPRYFIVGPPQMVVALRDMLNQSGVSNDDIRTETFSGY